MKLYRIKDWNERYENNRTRELKKIDWVPVPNKQDGEGYTLIMEQKDGPALLGAWLAIIQIASKCEMRGTLMRDTAMPHDSSSIARQSRFPKTVIERALTFLSSRDIGWIQITKIEDITEIPQEGAEIPQETVTEGKGKKEENGRELKRTESPFPKAPDEEFLKTLRSSPAYVGVDIDRELAKIDVWLLTPKGRGRKKTCQFILSWMNRVDRTIAPEARRNANDQPSASEAP